MKKILQLLLTYTLFFSPIVEAMNVTFINPGKPGERFWDMVTETMKAAADDFDINLEVIYAERNRIKMTSIGLQVTSRSTPPDYLILVNEEQAAEKIFLSSKGKNIKTIMLLNDFLPKQRTTVGFPGNDNPNLIGAVIPDNYAAGRRMMNALYQCAKKDSAKAPYHMLAIGGDQITPASIDRNKGALSVISEHQDIVLDRFLYANWNQQESTKLTQNYLNWASKNNIHPSAIWAANDPIAFGAKEAITANETKDNNICLVGLNWSAQGLKMVQDDEMLLTDGGHFLAGAWSMVLLHDYHQRSISGDTRAPGSINFQMQSIDKTNINQYVKNLGDENWGKINFRGFSLQPTTSYSEYDFSLKNVFAQIQ
ncbi:MULTISPECIES: ABC transporter substrate-binding protein [unclassified Neptuniibacter]|uniref:ABC transporter substrate-binding protein n=1 Tax=unclassified Neptuniibacter TaxID=2630693 RepID=UPI000C4F7C0E|nr:MULTISPECIES: ABC transporter substrate-binding protein [unclassified Neptuniibacter]MAY41623.1 hypothetical protein [Oceanospirillaceae bacterium]